MGIDAYLDEQREKVKIVDRLLEEYDDGRHDVFFCLAVNMLPPDDLNKLLKEAEREYATPDMKERAVYIQEKLFDRAEKLGIELNLRPWRS